MPYTPFNRFNSLQQDFDVSGSDYQNNNRLLTDETGGLGMPVVLNSGTAATITAFASPSLTIGGLTGQSAASVGTLILLTFGAEAGNNGLFKVTSNTSASVDVVSDVNGFFPDANSGAIAWTQFNSGAAPVTSTIVGGVVTITGLANMTANSVGNFLQMDGFTNPGNNGTFLIVNFNSATSVDVANSTAVTADTGTSWIERHAYVINDDLDFERTDRTAIKGVNYDQPVPTYTRPTLLGVPVPTTLFNIAGKTLDAQANSINRGVFSAPVEKTLTDIYGTNLYKHANSVDKTGVPCFDAAPFVSDYNSCYVEVTNPADGNELEVQGGGHLGEKIFGITTGGTSTSPNSVEIDWYSAPPGSNITSSSTPYTWEMGAATGTNTGTTTVTVTPGANGLSAITGLTGGTFTTGTDVGNWVTFSGLVNGANNGSFVIVSVQGTSAITVQNHAAVAETATAAVTWTEFHKLVPTFVNLTYGFNVRLDQLDQNALRFPFVSGLTADSDLRQDIIDLQSTGGWADGTTNLGTYLTNTTTFFPFSNLGGGAADTVVSALNVLNAQFGNLTFTGPYLVNNETITAALQALSNAIAGSTVTRYIERLAADAPANTSHLLPGGATYILDGTNNGRGLFVYWNGLLRDPGTVANGDDYSETNTTHITPYSKVKSGHHINYFVA